MISEQLLLTYNAIVKSFQSDAVIFYEGQPARYYTQIKTGGIKMFNLHENGKEFVQGVFKTGESFGEPPLFGNFNYPASAAATEPTALYMLGKDDFHRLLHDHFNIHLKFSEILSNRLSYKAMILKEISMHSPEHRILTLIDFLKEKELSQSKYLVPLTRQELANLTGLRVETVIRAVKQLEAEGEIDIVNRKVYR
ncbi:MAG: Crp/Fnr family transcriptional regulator [Bacteroidetes bacterium]|nr:Crp/Fnr family transcriptional regulator [Bacteroidota bacterium]